MIQDEDGYRATFHVRQCDRCCGNCKHFERYYEEAGCDHPRQREFDGDAEEHTLYGAYGGISVNEGNVCDLWERKEAANG